MARFLTNLAVEQVRRKLDAATPELGMYVLTRPLVYESDIVNCRITVPKGFRTDFASVPRLPLAYFLFGGDLGDNPAATVHDYLYSTGLVPRATADAVFKEAMQALDVAGWRRWPMWLGVRLFGGSHYATKP